MPTPTPGGQLADLKAMFDDPLFSMVAHLASSPNFGSLDVLQLSDLVECNFAGYAAVPLVPTIDNSIDEVGYGEMDPVSVEFIAGAGVAPQTVTAVYVTKEYNGENKTLASIIFFDRAIEISEVGQVVEQTIYIEGLGYAD